MAWKVKLSTLAQKNLKQFDVKTVNRLLVFLSNRVAKLDHPRMIGEALKGSKFSNLWKYRVGDYRIICDIQDEEIVSTLALINVNKVNAFL